MSIEQGRVDVLRKAGLDFAEEPQRVESPLRMRYTAETKVFRAQYGGLEDIRQRLGFSRRKMCQLLLVDPSAWTRWMKDESKVPPHIYRSLEWFLALNQKALTQPELAAVFSQRYQVSRNIGVSGERLTIEIDKLRTELRRQKHVSMLLTSAVAALAVTLLFFLS